MAWFIGQSLFIILAAFLLGLLAGWLVWGRRKSSPSSAKAISTAAPERPERNDGTIVAPAAPTVPTAPSAATVPVTAAPTAAATRVATAPTVAAAPSAAAAPAIPTVPTVAGARVAAGTEPDDIVDDDLGRGTGGTVDVPADGRPARTATPAARDHDADDDLERIEGIGPKFAAALRAAGIHSFRQLADTDDATRRAAIEAAGLSFAPSLVTWGRQARLLADGDEAGFLELTERLIAGRDTGADDDLERIEGIGPKFAAALRAAGIHSFRQLADTDDATRRAAIEAAGLSFAPSLVTWGRQARLLADGDEAGFLELTERLIAGRDAGRA
ncbi:helix-hairpin-helix domain-containing protein [Micromonospora sp. NPDC049559]|uniref:helix-hairpin-helix domain-containing protein n=1 Tax=Micromonospora sp. NPDC049559 TaxID=3155923 RepID=UPI003429491E